MAYGPGTVDFRFKYWNGFGPWWVSLEVAAEVQDASWPAWFLAWDCSSLDATDVVDWNQNEKDQQILQHVNVDRAASAAENKDAS